MAHISDIKLIRTDTTLDLSQKAEKGLCGSKWVKKLFYKISIAVVSTGVQYETFVIGSNEDMQFWCIGTESSVDDGGGASTSMPVVTAGGLLAEPPSVPLAATRSPGLILRLFGEGEPDHIENAMREDDPDDEPNHIFGDSEEDTPRTPPARRGPSSSGSGQQPPHFSTLNLEAIWPASGHISFG
ncbi:uncharacterized protein DS421_19g642880 [Arachis hypogaea]|uniref:Uncharacterized protein n=1 Tax=Arachis hypogaea TaxID=3818 RepID=A0A6B9V5U4_ARAHY|nr:uncharacterized protein DS421_19g642880 [Arachis hypogaea]